MSGRRAAKIDANQPDIVKALRAHRCDVLSLAAIGDGCPDLLVWSPWTRSHELLEVKDGAKPPSARKLTGDQVKFHAKWQGPIHVVTSVAEALRAVGVPEDLMNSVSVKDFGAIGNGVADDTAAIHAAIKHAIKTQKHTVIFPAGNYKVTPPVGQADGLNEG